MKSFFLVLAAVVTVIAQDNSMTASATDAMTAMATTPMDTMTAAPPMTTDASLASELSLGSCVTGASYTNCMNGLTMGALCTTGDANALVRCACSSASHAISCLNICSVSYDQQIIGLLSTTCRSLAGVGVPTTGGSAPKATGASAGSANMAGAAFPRITGGVAAGLAVAGGLAAFL